jgi:hypothetical protein
MSTNAVPTIENEKIVALTINGKSAKASYMRGLKKAQETNFWRLYTEKAIAQNPWSGVTVELNALEASIYFWCMGWYARYQRGASTQCPIQTYDDMKYLFLALNSTAYMDLLD